MPPHIFLHGKKEIFLCEWKSFAVKLLFIHLMLLQKFAFHFGGKKSSGETRIKQMYSPFLYT